MRNKSVFVGIAVEIEMVFAETVRYLQPMCVLIIVIVYKRLCAYGRLARKRQRAVVIFYISEIEQSVFS